MNIVMLRLSRQHCRPACVEIGFFASSSVAIFLLLLLLSSPSRADLVLTAPNLSATQGSSGSFDLVITDTDPVGSAPLKIAGFGIEFEVSGAGVQFTDTTTGTAPPYLYVGNSFDDINGFTMDATVVPYPKSHLIVSDLANDVPLFQIVNPGDTFGVTHVSFSVDGGATPGLRNLTFDRVNLITTFSDPNGVLIPVTSIDGSIAVSAVPEPTSALLALTVAPLIMWRRRGDGGR